MKKRSVLFVDDEPEILSAIKRLMVDEPFDILFSESGEDALNLLKSIDVHVVVVDLRMPKMGGLSLLKEIERFDPDIIRLVLSVSSDSDSILSATNRGNVHRYITKPWNDKELKIIVKQSVHLFNEQQEKRDLRKKLEENNILLEQKLIECRQAKAELKQSYSTLVQQEKMASIGQLAAGVAHEINNPTGFVNSNLNSLDKYVGRLIEFIEAQNEAVESLVCKDIKNSLVEKNKEMKIDYICNDIKEVIKECLEGTNRISNIVNHLKGFSRLDTDKIKGINLNQCLDSTLNVVWNELKYKTTVEKDYGELPPIEGYQQQLTQVFVNILINAAQAIEKQGDIKIKTYNNNGSNFIIISDTGCGISEDNKNNIFKPFFTTKEVGKGTGLGMSIAYDIVLKHNGKIDVESEVGTGTTFKIELPTVESKT